MTIDQINRWRIHQNTSLTLFIEAWYTRTEEERLDLPVTLHVGIGGMPSRIEDEEGMVICSYSIVDNQPYVHWIRSLEDLDRINELGHNYEANREYVDYGNDGGIETEKGV